MLVCRSTIRFFWQPTTKNGIDFHTAQHSIRIYSMTQSLSGTIYVEKTPATMCPTFEETFSACMLKRCALKHSADRYIRVHDTVLSIIWRVCFVCVLRPMGVCTEFSHNISFRPLRIEIIGGPTKRASRINLLCKCCQCAVWRKCIYIYCINAACFGKIVCQGAVYDLVRHIVHPEME